MCTVAMEPPEPVVRKPKAIHCGLFESASVLRPDKKSLTKAVSVKPEDLKAVASAVAACKLGLVDQLVAILDTSSAVVDATDIEGRTCLHYAAGYGHEECVDTLMAHGASVSIRDGNGDTSLHFAAVHGHPMCAYTLAKADPGTCLSLNTRGQNPVEVAAACERREVLNAMLLSCAGDAGQIAVQAMKVLLVEGAVPDTWAPNGSSALMLAASANGTEALKVLLDNGASIELQDALGRSALMFAAGNNAAGALNTLLDAGACIAARDRRGRSALEYAPDGSEAKHLLQDRLQALEDVAAKLQQDLLASLDAKAAPKAATSTSKSKSKRKKSKSSKKAKSEAAAKAKDVAAADAPSAAAAQLPSNDTATVKEEEAVVDLCSADQESEAEILAIALQSTAEVERDNDDSCDGVGQLLDGVDQSSVVSTDKADMPDAWQIEEDDASDWQLVGKNQRSSSKSLPEASPPLATSTPRRREPSSITLSQKPLSATFRPSRCPPTKDTTTPTAFTVPSHNTPADSTPVPVTNTTPRSFAHALKPPTPTSAPRHDLPPRLSLTAALNLPAACTTQQRDPAWPSKPQGTPFGFKAALLNQPSVLSGFSSSPHSTTSSSVFGSEPICNEQQLSEQFTVDAESAGPTPAEAVAAEHGSELVVPEQAKSSAGGMRTSVAVDAQQGAAADGATCTVATQTVSEREVEGLRRQVALLQQSQQQLRRELQLADLKHQQELSAVLEDAAQHKLEAMALAAQSERTRISAQLQLLGFSSELLRALLHPASLDLLSLIDAPHVALPLHPTPSSSPWSPPLFDPSTIAASKWDNLSFPASAPVPITPPTSTPRISNSSPIGSFDSASLTFPDLSCSITQASRNASGSSIAGFTDASSSYMSSAMSPLSSGSPCFNMSGHATSHLSLFSKPWTVKEARPLGQLPNLPESLDDDFASRLTTIMERADRYTPFGCSKQLHAFVDPIKDIPLPESALISNH